MRRRFTGASPGLLCSDLEGSSLIVHPCLSAHPSAWLGCTQSSETVACLPSQLTPISAEVKHPRLVAEGQVEAIGGKVQKKIGQVQKILGA